MKNKNRFRWHSTQALRNGKFFLPDEGVPVICEVGEDLPKVLCLYYDADSWEGPPDGGYYWGTPEGIEYNLEDVEYWTYFQPPPSKSGTYWSKTATLTEEELREFNEANPFTREE